MNIIGPYILSIVFIVLCLLSLLKKINAYDIFINGCKEGILLFYEVFPSLLAMMFCIRLLESSIIIEFIEYLCTLFKLSIPTSILPMFFFRPISGSASLALYIDLLAKEGGDSLAAILGGTIQGATDTTFYVVALYYSSVHVKKVGHSLWLSLLADGVAMGLGIYLVLNSFYR